MKSPYSNYLCRTLDIAAVRTISNVFSFDTLHCQTKIRTHPLPKNERMRYVFSQGRGLKGTKLTLLWSANRNETSDSNLIPTFLNHASDKQTSLGEAYCMETI